MPSFVDSTLSIAYFPDQALIKRITANKVETRVRGFFLNSRHRESVHFHRASSTHRRPKGVLRSGASREVENGSLPSGSGMG